MDYIFENQYTMFLDNQKQQKLDMDRYINECLILANPEKKNAFNEMVAMNEAAGDNAKNIFKRIADFIKKIWGKFVEKLTNLVASNKTYLEKYKDIILKKKPLDATYVMRDYATGIKNIVATSVPMFNYTTLKDKLSDAITFNKFLTQGKNPAYSEKVEFADYCKDLFRGSTEDKEFNSNELNMTDIYNYCYNYTKMSETIEKDKTTIEKAAIDAGKVIDSIKPPANANNNQTANSATPAANATATGASNTQTGGNQATATHPRVGQGNPLPGPTVNNNSALFADTATYSAVYEQYITEVEIKKDGNTSGSSTTSSTPANTSAAANVTNITKGTEKATNDETKAAVGDQIDEAKDRINVYMDSCRTLLAAKLTVCEEIYKNYMQIIRSHVNDFVGTDEASKQDKVQQSATAYNKLSDPIKNFIDKHLGGSDGVANTDINDLNTAIDNGVTQDGLSSDFAKSVKTAVQNMKK